MNEKVKKRITLTQCVAKNAPAPHLRASVDHKDGHPYTLDYETYVFPLPIPRELTDQIAKSKPNDGILSLLKIPPRIFTNFVRMTESWMNHHDNSNLSSFIQPQSDIEFAKELFKIWDENDTGKLNLEELTLPLIALGLINDTTFIMRLLKSISNRGSSKAGNMPEKTDITIVEFVKIFKNNPFV